MNSRQQYFYDLIKEKMEREHPGARFKEGTRYVNSTTLMPIVCENKHDYGLHPRHFIHSNAWCDACGGNRKKTLADYQELACSKGGVYTLDVIPRATSVPTYGWKCACTYEWRASYRDVAHSNTWCPECAKCRKRTLQDYQKLAQSKGFVYFPDSIPSETHIPVEGWRCGATPPHTWKACYASIRGGSGCPHCSGCAHKTLQDYRELARQRGGEYRSSEVPPNVITPTDGWWCGKHQWTNDYHNIQSGRWCPVCRETHLERAIRLALEQLNISALQPQLRLPGTAYKFDFGSHELKLLIEGDGAGHFLSIEHWGGEDGLRNAQCRDILKTQWAMDHGYRLLRIDDGYLAYVREHVEWFLSHPEARFVVTDASRYEYLLTAVQWPVAINFHHG